MTVKSDKQREAVIKRYGSWQAYLEASRAAGKVGGRKSTGSFTKGSQRAKESGRKGYRSMLKKMGAKS